MNSTATYTKSALLAFLRKAEATGLYKANTVGGLRAAASKLLEDIEDGDDVRSIDVEQTALRYHNKHPSELSSASRGEYQRRLRRLLSEFAAFNENPAGYRPKARVASSNGAKALSGKDQRPHKRPKAEAQATEKYANTTTASSDVSSVPMLRLSYPIRDEVLAEVAVPRGMTTDEAKRLCAFVMTLAKDFAPS